MVHRMIVVRQPVTQTRRVLHESALLDGLPPLQHGAALLGYIQHIHPPSLSFLSLLFFFSSLKKT